MEKSKREAYQKLPSRILLGAAILFVVLAGAIHFIKNNIRQNYIDQNPLKELAALDKQNHNATFVFVDPAFARQISQNKTVLLEPIGDNLNIDSDKYLHKGHNGPLFIIMPDSYAGPKEKMILKSFPDYKGWYASMIGNGYVMYSAK